jgi:hypothetical protein
MGLMSCGNTIFFYFLLVAVTLHYPQTDFPRLFSEKNLAFVNDNLAKMLPNTTVELKGVTEDYQSHLETTCRSLEKNGDIVMVGPTDLSVLADCFEDLWSIDSSIGVGMDTPMLQNNVLKGKLCKHFYNSSQWLFLLKHHLGHYFIMKVLLTRAD